MSYIDCFDHEYIGCLGYLPIYHPLQQIVGGRWGSYDFSANTDNLILGGGSGEHPAIVLHKLDSLAAKFLYDQIPDETESKLSAQDRDYLIDLSFTDGQFEFCGWTINDYAALKSMALSTAFYRPLAEDEQVEDWLAKSIGELVFFCLSDLNPAHNLLRQIASGIAVHATMRNVLCSPPGYPASGGRSVVDGKVVWGRQRWK